MADVIHDPGDRSLGPGGRWLAWAAALALVGGLVFAHRQWDHGDVRTGRIEVAGRSQRYQLPQTWSLDQGGAKIELKLNGEMPELDGAVLWRPAPGDKPFVAAPLDQTRRRVTRPGESRKQWTELAARLPRRPPSSRIDYHIALTVDGRDLRIPPGREMIPLRYLGAMPQEVSLARNTIFLLALLLSIRAGVSALFDSGTLRRYAWGALLVTTAGGLTAQAVANRYAFDDYWMGFPEGSAWADNRLLLVGLVWLIACLVLGRSTSRVGPAGRAVALGASVAMAGLAISG